MIVMNHVFTSIRQKMGKDLVLWPMVLPFVCQHDVTFQNYNAWPHRLCKQLL